MGLLPISDAWTWGILITCVSILIIGLFLGGRGKAFKWLKVLAVSGTVIIVMAQFVGPALIDMGDGGNGDGGFTPLFTMSMAISADCNDLTGLDAVADCAVAGELNFRSDDREMDVLFTIDQELVTVLAPDENGVDFTLERYCEGPDDAIHCPRGDDGDYYPASVDVEVVSWAMIHNETSGFDVQITEKTAAGTDICSWSDGTNVVLGKHKASPLQLEPGEEGTITFAHEFDPVFFGATGIDDEMSLDSTVLAIAGQTVTINHIVVSYTA